MLFRSIVVALFWPRRFVLLSVFMLLVECHRFRSVAMQGAGAAAESQEHTVDAASGPAGLLKLDWGNVAA